MQFLKHWEHLTSTACHQYFAPPTPAPTAYYRVPFSIMPSINSSAIATNSQNGDCSLF